LSDPWEAFTTTSSEGAAELVVVTVSSPGGCIMTILPHLGHARICPIAELSRTRSRDWHVVQEIENGSTKRLPRGELGEANDARGVSLGRVRVPNMPEAGC
jgi:hypothetical protein